MTYNGSNLYSKMGERKVHYITFVCCLFNDPFQVLYHAALTIIQDYFTLLDFQDEFGEIENAHRTGKKRNDKPRQIIVKLFSRLFKRAFLRVAKSQENKEALNGVRF